MTSPFLPNPVTSQRKLFDEHFVEKEFLARQNPLAFPDSYLYERYRFSAEGMSYLCELLDPHIKNLTRRIHALTVPQILRCVFLLLQVVHSCTVGDAQKLGENTVCRTIRKVVLALQEYMNSFINSVPRTFIGHVHKRGLL
ncbi:hypothetical protein PO909_008488 [Leuciscus waleckii]